MSSANLSICTSPYSSHPLLSRTSSRINRGKAEHSFSDKSSPRLLPPPPPPLEWNPPHLPSPSRTADPRSLRHLRHLAYSIDAQQRSERAAEARAAALRAQSLAARRRLELSTRRRADAQLDAITAQRERRIAALSPGRHLRRAMSQPAGRPWRLPPSPSLAEAEGGVAKGVRRVAEEHARQVREWEAVVAQRNEASAASVRKRLEASARREEARAARVGEVKGRQLAEREAAAREEAALKAAIAERRTRAQQCRHEQWEAERREAMALGQMRAKSVERAAALRGVGRRSRGWGQGDGRGAGAHFHDERSAPLLRHLLHGICAAESFLAGRGLLEPFFDGHQVSLLLAALNTDEQACNGSRPLGAS
ncbi:hypothetical protein AB1Y20_012003 [Prymnesium parvum]|uniref:Uncharacterized protein n=1 Tax=Prymnesium parvum TaxID=97485 RepID=A0AB34IPP9_PRYPA